MYVENELYSSWLEMAGAFQISEFVDLEKLRSDIQEIYGILDETYEDQASV